MDGQNAQINFISPYISYSYDDFLGNEEELDSDFSNDKLLFPFYPNISMKQPYLLNDYKSNDNIIDTSSIMIINKTSENTSVTFLNKKNPRCFDIDNIIRKIKVHYMNKFLIKFINIIIKTKFGANDKYSEIRFCPLLHDKLKKTTKDCLNKLKDQTIKDVIKTEISRRYIKNFQSDYNEKLCQKIEEEEELKDINDILELKFLYFFEKIYIEKREKKKINLKEYELCDLEIDISKLELFEDLKLKNENRENSDIYEMRLEKYKNIFLNPNLKINKFKIRKMSNKK